MNIEIKICDEEGEDALILTSCDRVELVEISLVRSDLNSAIVPIEDIKQALRKLCTK